MALALKTILIYAAFVGLMIALGTLTMAWPVRLLGIASGGIFFAPLLSDCWPAAPRRDE